jgi:hypothetical protein
VPEPRNRGRGQVVGALRQNRVGVHAAQDAERGEHGQDEQDHDRAGQILCGEIGSARVRLVAFRPGRIVPDSDWVLLIGYS